MTRCQTDQEVKDRLIRQVIRAPNGCWLFTGGKNHGGYGRFSWNGTLYQAHRVSYELFVKPIPDGMTIDHTCNVPSCVNPDHLRPMTHEENCARQRREMTHCHRGHPLSGDNLLAIKGRRHCRECNRIRRDKYRDRRQGDAHDAR